MSRPDGPPGRQLPPELDPRGRRAARRASRARAGERSQLRADRRAAGAGRSGFPDGDAPAVMGPVGSRTGRPDRTGRRGGGAKHGALVAVRVVAALLSLAIVIGSGYAWASYKKFTGGVEKGSALPAATGRDVDGTDQNILLIGNDSRAGATPAELNELSTEDDGGSINTDTMILLHVPANGQRASLISFPRDSYVALPDGSHGRLNSAYPAAYSASKAAGGSERDAESAGILATASTISNLTGLTVDHYVQVSLLGFYRISQAIGGVDVCLNQRMGPATEYGQEGEGYDSGFEPNGDFVYSYSGIDLPAGVSHGVEGKQALAFVRQRHGLPGGDLDRAARQQYFLKAVFTKVSSGGVLLNPFKLNDLLSAVSSSLFTDPTLNLLDLASQVQGLQTGNISTATIPTTGNEMIDGAAVLGIDEDAVKAFVQQILNPAKDEIAAAQTVAPGSFAVTVLNGGAASGDAAYNGQLLTNAGYNVAATADAPNQVANTQIQYPAGMAAQAKTLLAVVPGATAVMSSSVSGVTLVLGPDGVHVTDPSQPSAPDTPATTTSGSAAAAGGLACIN